MDQSIGLEQFLADRVRRHAIRQDLAAVLTAIAATGIELAGVIARRGLAATAPGAADIVTELPLPAISQQLFVDALQRQPISLITSEKTENLLEVDAGASLAVAIDPLDGATNTDINAAIGTVFALLRADSQSLFQQPLGEMLEAAGFLFYGPQVRLLLSCGDGSYDFVLDSRRGCFCLRGEAIAIPDGRREFAIDFANYRFWDEGLRYFVDDCIAGASGPMGEDYNMCWTASLVAAAFRILVRGGVFLYPGDARPGCSHGRLRLLHEALPLAFLIEQSGGLAGDGVEAITAKRLGALHERAALIFGARDRVEEVIGYISGEALQNTRFPLFAHRSLFRS